MGGYAGSSKGTATATNCFVSVSSITNSGTSYAFTTQTGLAPNITYTTSKPDGGGGGGGIMGGYAGDNGTAYVSSCYVNVIDRIDNAGIGGGGGIFGGCSGSNGIVYAAKSSVYVNGTITHSMPILGVDAPAYIVPKTATSGTTLYDIVYNTKKKTYNSSIASSDGNIYGGGGGIMGGLTYNGHISSCSVIANTITNSGTFGGGGGMMGGGQIDSATNPVLHISGCSVLCIGAINNGFSNPPGNTIGNRTIVYGGGGGIVGGGRGFAYASTIITNCEVMAGSIRNSIV